MTNFKRANFSLLEVTTEITNNTDDPIPTGVLLNYADGSYTVAVDLLNGVTNSPEYKMGDGRFISLTVMGIVEVTVNTTEAITRGEGLTFNSVNKAFERASNGILNNITALESATAGYIGPLQAFITPKGSP